MTLWDFSIIAFCIYLHFTQRLCLFGTGVADNKMLIACYFWQPDDTHEAQPEIKVKPVPAPRLKLYQQTNSTSNKAESSNKAGSIAPTAVSWALFFHLITYWLIKIADTNKYVLIHFLFFVTRLPVDPLWAIRGLSLLALLPNHQPILKKCWKTSNRRKRFKCSFTRDGRKVLLSLERILGELCVLVGFVTRKLMPFHGC